MIVGAAGSINPLARDQERLQARDQDRLYQRAENRQANSHVREDSAAVGNDAEGRAPRSSLSMQAQQGSGSSRDADRQGISSSSQVAAPAGRAPPVPESAPVRATPAGACDRVKRLLHAELRRIWEKEGRRADSSLRRLVDSPDTEDFRRALASLNSDGPCSAEEQAILAEEVLTSFIFGLFKESDPDIAWIPGVGRFVLRVDYPDMPEFPRKLRRSSIAAQDLNYNSDSGSEEEEDEEEGGPSQRQEHADLTGKSVPRLLTAELRELKTLGIHRVSDAQLREMGFNTDITREYVRQGCHDESILEEDTEFERCAKKFFDSARRCFGERVHPVVKCEARRQALLLPEASARQCGRGRQWRRQWSAAGQHAASPPAWSTGQGRGRRGAQDGA